MYLNSEFQLGEVSPKSDDYIRHSTAWINIAEGSVRSGKTVTCCITWLKFLGESPHDEFLISSKTHATLERNVLRPLFKIMNSVGIRYRYYNNRYHSLLDIEGKTCYLMGFNDEGATDTVAGMTVGGWLGDEVTRNPQSTIEMAISRCSLPGARMFLNMNPSSPYHFLYTNYINNPELIKAGTVKVWKFLLEDNPNLPKQYVEELVRVNKKSALFYKRNILGQWVAAEGAIYDMFDEDKHTFKGNITDKMDNINICCDYGVSTVTTFGVMGIEKDINNGNTYYLLDETYYDAEVRGIQQSDDERLETVLGLQKKYKLGRDNILFLPHDAGSLKALCRKDPRLKMRVRTYTPDTFKDITTIQQLFNQNRFKIHQKCQNSIKQAQTYSWDTKAQQRGEDRPLKHDDHCPDMWRLGIIPVMKNARRAKINA